MPGRRRSTSSANRRHRGDLPRRRHRLRADLVLQRVRGHADPHDALTRCAQMQVNRRHHGQQQGRRGEHRRRRCAAASRRARRAARRPNRCPPRRSARPRPPHRRAARPRPCDCRPRRVTTSKRTSAGHRRAHRPHRSDERHARARSLRRQSRPTVATPTPAGGPPRQRRPTATHALGAVLTWRGTRTRCADTHPAQHRTRAAHLRRPRRGGCRRRCRGGPRRALLQPSWSPTPPCRWSSA